MKSLKSILAFCALAAIPAFGDVEALYWQVTTGEGGNNPENISFTYAALVGTDGSTSKYIADENGIQFHNATGDGTTTDVIASIMDSTCTGLNFYIELWNYDNGNWSLAGTAGGPPGESYAKLKEDGVIRSSMSLDNTTLFTPAVSIPEPTSGLLLLMGGALLALRRRRNAAMA